VHECEHGWVKAEFRRSEVGGRSQVGRDRRARRLFASGVRGGSREQGAVKRRREEEICGV